MTRRVERQEKQIIPSTEPKVRGYIDAALLLPARQPDLDRDTPRYMDFKASFDNKDSKKPSLSAQKSNTTQEK